MAIASVTKLAAVKHEDGIDIGLTGLMQILTRRTRRADPNYSELGALTDQELVTIANQARNIHTAALNGLETVGTLVSGFNPQFGELEHNSVGWLTSHLSETVRVIGDLEWIANCELANRGYATDGSPLLQRAQA